MFISRLPFHLLILGVFGALISIYKKNWLTLYPLAWSALAYTLSTFLYTRFLSSPAIDHHPHGNAGCSGRWGWNSLSCTLETIILTLSTSNFIGISALIGFALGIHPLCASCLTKS